MTYQEVDELLRQLGEKNAEITGSFKRHVAAGSTGPDEAHEALLEQRQELSDRLAAAMERVRVKLGITEGDLRMLDERRRSRRSAFTDQDTRSSFKQTPVADWFEDQVPEALRRVEQLAPEAWLNAEAVKPYRMPADESEPLVLVGSERVVQYRRPHRLARMILCGRDFLAGRTDMDLYDVAKLVPELTALGRALEVIAGVGNGRERAAELPDLTDQMAASRIYEILVAAGCARAGRKIEFVDETPTAKTPDLRIKDLGIPLVVECKRKAGLFDLERAEADLARQAFLALHGQGLLTGRRVELEVGVEDPKLLSAQEVVLAVQEAVSSGSQSMKRVWGGVTIVALAASVQLPEPVLVFAPAFLRAVFGWDREEPTWDGIVCNVSGPRGVLTQTATGAECVVWRNVSEEGRTKKARGIQSLYGQAAQQIPPGEIGLVYIAYEDNARSELSDQRTQNIIQASRNREYYHKAMVAVRLVVVSRLFSDPQPRGEPDLVENAAILVETGKHEILDFVPTLVFTRSTDPD